MSIKNTTVNEVEEIENLIEEEEFEAICKNVSKFQFPAIYLGKTFNQIVFNSYASELVPDYIEWFASTNYVIGIPAKANGKNAFKTWGPKKSRTACAPVALVKEKGLKPGYYKVYKYKNGFAFKRYEQLEA